MTPAPFFADLADGPEGGEAVWLRCDDGVRIRAGVWPVGTRGTVLLFNGRSEYVEKYGRAARDLGARGYATLSMDWRGQGLADRAVADPMVGHVGGFAEYQHDVDAVLGLARELGLPEPYVLLAHSMGGCIGLRTLTRGLPITSAVFSAPMWGISMAAWQRPLASVVSAVSGWFGQAHRYTPGTGAVTYVAEAAFQGNVLTTDPDMWDYMVRQATAHPELTLGGPSLTWLNAALVECNALSLIPSPDLACLTALGTGERVVDPGPVHLRMAAWPKGRLELYPGAEHEIIMEAPAFRQRFFDSAADVFSAAP